MPSFNQKLKRLEEIVSGKEFKGIIDYFSQTNCHHFKDDHPTEDQKKLRTKLFSTYTALIEAHIEKKMALSIPGFNTAQFLEEFCEKEDLDVDSQLNNSLGTLGDANRFQQKMKEAVAKMRKENRQGRQGSPTMEERGFSSPEVIRKRKHEENQKAAEAKRQHQKESKAFPTRTPVDISGLRGRVGSQVNGKRGIVLGLATDNKRIKVAVQGASKVHLVEQRHLTRMKRVPPNAIARVADMGKGRAYRAVWVFKKLKTNGNLTREDMIENRTGQIVSRAKHFLGKNRFEKVELWIKALQQARSDQKITGFLPAKKKGGTKKQKALYDRAQEIHQDLKSQCLLSALMSMDEGTAKNFKEHISKIASSKLDKFLPPPNAKK